MFSPFFQLAAVSPGRQATFRYLVAFHLVLVSVAAGLALSVPEAANTLLGHIVLTAGIVEGGLLIGWRLTQLPKSQALEFLLVSPLRPRGLFLAEVCVGLVRLAFISLSGLPLYALLVVQGILLPTDLPALVLMPWTWGAITGLTLVTWAYEPVWIRRWGERVIMLLIVLYLGVGVLAAEKMALWVADLPPALGALFLEGFRGFHAYSPFTVLRDVLRDPWEEVLGRCLSLEAGALVVLALLMWRAASRLQEHFRDRHYSPAVDVRGKVRSGVGDRPLSWWAVKRVSEYSGRVNLWLAGGFAMLYSAYIVAGDSWPDWLGSQVFVTFDHMGGVPTMATALIVLAAVPAAFQYGLWDSSAQDRCRRLELLLLTDLDGRDYWQAAAAAAWRRGRGYFAVALVLWSAMIVAGRVEGIQVLAALACAVILWGFYFALGFRAFAHGMQANHLGMVLTLGLPLVVCILYHFDLGPLAALVAPGSVYYPMTSLAHIAWMPGPLLVGAYTLVHGKSTRQQCVDDLHRWYDMNHGKKNME